MTVLESVQRFCQRTYAFEYIGLGILIAGYTLTEISFEPFHTLFRLDDARIQYPHAEVERVSLLMLLIYSIAVPFILIAVYNLVSRSPAHAFQVSLLGLSISLMLTELVTNVFKNAVGRPRPDLISRCKPKPGTPTDQLVGIEVCTETRVHTLQDGWRSFPSGHSSFAFAGLGYLTLYFAGQFHLFRPNSNLTSLILTVIPLIGAGMIAVSRLEDYRHGPIDVLTGSLLGFIVAYGAYRRYFPAWRSLEPHIPHKLPTDKRRIRDEETGGRGAVRPDHEDFDLADDDDSDEIPLTSNRG
ncbi:PAP2-domain-containing protein [Microthyrium microscopicum]|uniref:PAP2-domain-containing protein n=1 Tax=Microthyrium microscopicum TaxID=703497 RepID=A0A6A6UGN5_9PEZI|nr:PAP2-domain-containing protein [Microthyrium microscopicum]